MYELPYARAPHPCYGKRQDPGLQDDPLLGRHPARLLRRLHLLLDHRARGPHHPEPLGRLGAPRDRDRCATRCPGFTGVISDLGGPTANMYRLACKSREIESACRRPSCVYPGICPNLNTDHSAADQALSPARALPGIKKVLIASGVRYDLAIESPEYVKELAQHHVGGYLKIAPEAIARGAAVEDDEAGRRHLLPLQGAVRQYSKEAGKEQYLIPYFIAAHPGHHRRGHARARAVAQEERLPRRPGAGLPALADGHRDRDVSHAARIRCARDARQRRGA